MAHMSSLDAAKNKMKAIRKSRANKRAEMATISPEEKERLQQERYNKTLREQVDAALYDFDHHQYPIVKYKLLKALLTTRLKELKIELRSKLDVTNEYTDIEKEVVLKNRNDNIKLKIEKIEKVLAKVNMVVN